MASKKQPTKKYVITRHNCYRGEVGATVELTEAEAAKLVNKVRPADETPVGQKGDKAAVDKRVADLEAEVDSLKSAAATNAAILAYLDKAGENDPALAAYMQASRKTVEAG